MGKEAVPKNDDSQNVRIVAVRQAESRDLLCQPSVQNDSRSEVGSCCRLRTATA